MTTRSVILPERFKEVVVDPLEKTREMLFVGAIMNLAEQLKNLYDDKDVHQLALSAREHIATVAHNITSTEVQDVNNRKEACTRALMEILAIAGKTDTNVALGALRLYHRDKDIKDEVVSDPNEKGAE